VAAQQAAPSNDALFSANAAAQPQTDFMFVPSYELQSGQPIETLPDKVKL
jgi:hypothetical protein